jgi:magnesium transporter
MLWVDLCAPSPDESRQAQEAFGLAEEPRSGARGSKARLEQEDGYLVVTAVAVSDEEEDVEKERVVLTCWVGERWLLTVHDADVAVLDDFRQTVSGEGEIGILDAPSFLATMLEWVVTSYLHAFDEIETELERFDIEALSNPSRRPEAQIETLIAARHRVGRLRRALVPHREVFSALGHSEFDPLSSESSSERFVALTSELDSALTSARDVRDAIASSFDVLIVRTEHRTNEIVKVLTLVSILLLPGALIAGIAGMNVNFKLDVFTDSALFWFVAATVVGIAAVSLVLARARDWI